MNQKEKFREIAAALCHEQWSGWMLYLFGRLQRKNDGSYVVSPEYADNLMRQQTTAYENLSETEKKIDRIEADKFIRLFGDNQEVMEIAALVDIREALDIDKKIMLAELSEIAGRIKRNADRYEKVRKLTPQQFSGLWLKALIDNIPLDGIIDAWIDRPISIFPEWDKENMRPKTKMPPCPRCGEDELGMMDKDTVFCYKCYFTIKRSLHTVKEEKS